MLKVEDTGMGVLEDKIIKNHFASEYIYNKHKNAKPIKVLSKLVKGFCSAILLQSSYSFF